MCLNVVTCKRLLRLTLYHSRRLLQGKHLTNPSCDYLVVKGQAASVFTWRLFLLVCWVAEKWQQLYPHSQRYWSPLGEAPSLSLTVNSTEKYAVKMSQFSTSALMWKELVEDLASKKADILNGEGMLSLWQEYTTVVLSVYFALPILAYPQMILPVVWGQ